MSEFDATVLLYLVPALIFMWVVITILFLKFNKKRDDCLKEEKEDGDK